MTRQVTRPVTAPEEAWHSIACQYARIWTRACAGTWPEQGTVRAIKFNRTLYKLAIAAVGVSQCLFQLQAGGDDDGTQNHHCIEAPRVWTSVQAMLRVDVPSTEKVLRMFAADDENAERLQATLKWWGMLVPLSSAGATAASAGTNTRTVRPVEPSAVTLEWLSPVVGELSQIRNSAELGRLLDYFRIVEVVAKDCADVQKLLDFTVYIFLVVKVMHMGRLSSGEWAPARTRELAQFAADDDDNNNHRGFGIRPTALLTV